MTPFSYAALWIVIAAGYLLVRRMNAGRRGLDRLFAETGAPMSSRPAMRHPLASFAAGSIWPAIGSPMRRKCLFGWKSPW